VPALPTRSPMARSEKDDTFTIPKGRRRRVYRPEGILPDKPHAVNPRALRLTTSIIIATIPSATAAPVRAALPPRQSTALDARRLTRSARNRGCRRHLIDSVPCRQSVPRLSGAVAAAGKATVQRSRQGFLSLGHEEPQHQQRASRGLYAAGTGDQGGITMIEGHEFRGG
jgi:hypothetical protein